MKTTESPGDSTRTPTRESDASRSADSALRVVKQELPPDFVDYDALKVVRRLTRFGYKAYLVGGGVRDLLLGATPKDFDVVTNARPREVRRVFRNCRLIGRRFRLAHIHFQGKIIEVSTFRRNPDDDVLRSVEAGEADADSLDLGDPSDLLIREDNVFGTEEQDARRRDFTCNALFYDLQREAILDYIGGMADVERKLIRTIGPPAIRFAEDPVRILRAVKFAARLDLKIDERTWEAARQLASEVAKCPAPRVLEELLRMLRSRNSHRAYHMLHKLGVLAYLLPELNVSAEDLALAVSGSEDTDDGENGKTAAIPDLAAERRTILAAVDAVQSRRSQPLPDAVLVAALFWPTIERRFQAARARSGGAGRARDFGAIISDTVREAATRLRMPRRLLGRTNLILLAQGKLGVGRRRRLRPEALVRREFFQDALTLFEIRARALDRGWDLLALWRKLTHAPHDRELVQAILRAPPLDEAGREEGSSGPAEDAGPRRRGRRGGRRRRRRRRGGANGANGTDGSNGVHEAAGANGTNGSNGANGTPVTAGSNGNGTDTDTPPVQQHTDGSTASHRPRRRRRSRRRKDATGATEPSSSDPGAAG